MDTFDEIAARQRRALDHMLDALSLDEFRGEAHRATRVVALERQAQALIRAYQRSQRRVAALERALMPDAAELEELAPRSLRHRAPAHEPRGLRPSDRVWLSF